MHKIAIILALLSLAVACGSPTGLKFRDPNAPNNNKPQNTPTPTPVPTATPTPGHDPWYARLNDKILKPKCLDCHKQPQPKADLDLSTYEKLVGTEGLIVKGDPESSNLYLVLETNEMPPRPNDPLTQAEKDEIYKWIKAGAPKEVPLDQNGNPAVQEPNQPGQPSQPGQPGQPAQPSQPGQPAEPGEPQEPVAGNKMRFGQLHAQVLGPKCVQCHGGEAVKAGVDLTTYEKVMALESLVVPGKPEESYLFEVVKTDQMPPREPIAAKEKELIHRWIKDGALK
ncbi:MAG TPA: c-type cytochrome domain-containing protein [Bdellovibrionales bacterium]|nr:c-type cytochrome domain-containing protein [Bdellovibrionales bacterium]